MMVMRWSSEDADDRPVMSSQGSLDEIVDIGSDNIYLIGKRSNGIYAAGNNI